MEQIGKRSISTVLSQVHESHRQTTARLTEINEQFQGKLAEHVEALLAEMVKVDAATAEHITMLEAAVTKINTDLASKIGGLNDRLAHQIAASFNAIDSNMMVVNKNIQAMQVAVLAAQKESFDEIKRDFWKLAFNSAWAALVRTWRARFARG